MFYIKLPNSKYKYWDNLLKQLKEIKYKDRVVRIMIGIDIIIITIRIITTI